MIRILVPEQLKKITDGKMELEVSGASSLSDLIERLDLTYSGFKARVSNRNFILFFVNGEDVRFLSGDSTPVKDGDEISIVAAVAGG